MKKTKKQWSALLTAAILFTGITAGGCGDGSSKSSMDAASGDSASPAGHSLSSYETKNDSAMTEEISESAGTDAAADAGEADQASGAAGDAAGADTPQNQNEKLIYTYRYTAETKTFDSFTEQISKKTSQLGGYIENSETNGSEVSGSGRYANMTLRIPSDKMHQMISFIDAESNVTYKNTSIENVTLQYVDIESHLKALRTEQKTLLRLIEKAEKLEDVVTLQSQLTQVRYEIESYESQLRLYDNMTDYSTMYLDISEVARTTTLSSAEKGFFEEIKDRFSDNLYALGRVLRALAIWLVSSLPLLLPLAAVVICATALLRRYLRHRKPKAPKRRSGTQRYRSIYASPSDAKAQAPDSVQDDSADTGGTDSAGS